MNLKLSLAKLYYRLTLWIPRPLPHTDAEINEMQYIMQEYLGLEKGLDIWYTVLSQITSGHPTSLYKSYGSMINAGKKLKIAGLVQDHKTIAHKTHMDMLKDKLEKAIEKVIDEGPKQEITGTESDHADVQDWTHSISTELSPLQEPQERMVNEGGVQRF